MQDRFKFRVFGKTNAPMLIQGMHNIQTIGIGEHGYHSISFDKGYISFVDKDQLKLMQCTGLKDTNGKLIYEGDIVTEISSGMVCIIEWHDPTHALMAHIRRMDEYVTLDELTNDFGDCPCEVIGNIYENPELLEGNNDKR